MKVMYDFYVFINYNIIVQLINRLIYSYMNYFIIRVTGTSNNYKQLNNT